MRSDSCREIRAASDAELAARREVTPVAPDVAADGVDEYLDVVLRHHRNAGTLRGTGSLHVHATDAPGEWLVRITPGSPPAGTREHARGDCAVRGPAWALDRLLWSRGGRENVEVIGDAAVLAHVLAIHI